MTDRLEDANPISRDEVERLSHHPARQELLEEIVSTTAPDRPTRTVRQSRPWLVPLVAAAAVVLIAAGAWWVTNDPDPKSKPDVQPAASPSAKKPVPADRWCMTDNITNKKSCKAMTTQPGGGEDEQHYQKPIRPMLIKAPGWEVDGVYGYTVSYRGPNGEKLSVNWIITSHPEDPFAYDKWGAAPGEEIRILGERTRLTSFTSEGATWQAALTSAVVEDGTSVSFESEGISPAAFREAVESARWVSLEEYEDAVKPD